METEGGGGEVGEEGTSSIGIPASSSSSFGGKGGGWVEREGGGRVVGEEGTSSIRIPASSSSFGGKGGGPEMERLDRVTGGRGWDCLPTSSSLGGKGGRLEAEEVGGRPDEAVEGGRGGGDWTPLSCPCG